MSLIDSVRYRLRVWLHPRAHERELTEEFDFHLGLDADRASEAAGGAVTAAELRRTVRRRFGNDVYWREETRRAAGLAFLDEVAQDARFAVRGFRRTAGFTTIAVLTLAIGIGANTAIFSAVDALLLRPLPFHEPERLMSVSLVVPPRGSNTGSDDVSWSGPKFETMREQATVFSRLTHWQPMTYTIRPGGGEALRTAGEFIDSRYMRTLGVRPALGRDMVAEEDRLGSRVVLLSDALWRATFDADPAVVGSVIDVDGDPFTVIGVMPRAFAGLSGAATFWVSLASRPPAYVTAPYNHQYHALARLADGVTPDAARAAVRRIGVSVDAQYPSQIPGIHWGATALELDATRVDGRIRTTLVILLMSAGFVLLIACANVANLMLVRASARRREIAVRLAIGAGRGRLIRQLVVESLVLALAGGVVSLVVAWVGVRALSLLDPATALRLRDVSGLGVVNFLAIRLHTSALLFAAVVTIATGLFFGLAPALQATRPGLIGTLKDDAMSPRRGLRRLTGGNALAVLEIALAVVLLAGSGLTLRSLAHLLGVRQGFDANGVLTMRVNRAPAWSRDSIATFFDRSIERLSALPGVTDVALVDCPPLNDGCGPTLDVALLDRPIPAPGASPWAGVHWMTPGLTAALRIALVRGRLLDAGDRLGAPRAVLINETAARRFWPDDDPIGKPLRIPIDGFGNDTARVVGVIGDVRFGTIDEPPAPELFVSYYQAPMTWRMMFVVRTDHDPAALGPAAVRALRDAAPGFPIYDVQPLEHFVAESVAYARVSALLLAMFAALALGLATLGVYGVISFATAQRTREIGVRVAMGATRGDVVKLVVGQGVLLVTLGASIGVAVALTATRALRFLLYGIEPGDPLTLAGIVVVLAGAVNARLLDPRSAGGGCAGDPRVEGGMMDDLGVSPEEVRPIARQRLSDTVARRLREQIQAHGCVEGDRLPSIAEMASGFRVGPPTVREALKKLEALGIVEARQGSGIFVGRGLPQILEALRDVLADDVLNAERMSRELAREPIVRKAERRSRRLAG